ncbi:DUF1548 domain-containing protein [Chlamydia crocodili]|uniref:DUF1548 domain-containing protein n=1 Tax=Chlamydia crocodili TaxID=2766982 RepID=A0ABX8CID0_9CHLA|nr:DUF1548 domain-containing protein [Chlamydia crocodili]QVE49337.1 DUF1548 domain-containing protein [Chlamydia crocodili]
MSVSLNPNNFYPPTSPDSPTSSCYKHITTLIKQINRYSLFSKLFREIGSTLRLQHPKSCLDHLLIALVCIVSLLLSLVLYILLLPIKLFTSAISCVHQRKTDEIPLLPETQKVFKPLTETEEAFLAEVKRAILQKVSGGFEINMSPEVLRLVPSPSAFLNSLAKTSYSKKLCDYKKLRRLIKNLNCWNSGWEIIMNYLTSLLKEDQSHPDTQTFPIMMYHLTLALEDPQISQENKSTILKEISSYANTCKPTWAETIFRSINNLYNTRNSGREQILLWSQMFKEHLLSQQQLVAHEEEWHQINGLKRLCGEQLGLITDHLNENLSPLTLRQTSTLPQNIVKYTELKNSFMQAYRRSYADLIKYIHNAFLTSEAEIQARIYNFLIEEVANVINLPETAAHIDLVVDCFYDDNYELKPEGITYLLYIMGIIVSKTNT